MELKKVNLSLIAFLAYSCRILYFGAKFEDAPVLLIMAAIYGFMKYLDTKSKLITENEFRSQVNEDISNIKSTVSGLSLNLNGNAFAGNKRR